MAFEQKKGYNVVYSTEGGNQGNSNGKNDSRKKSDDKRNSSYPLPEKYKKRRSLPASFKGILIRGNLDLDTIENAMFYYMNKVNAEEDTYTSNKNVITTSKLRNIMSMVSEVYNTESRSKKDKLSDDSISKLQRLRIRIVYEYGRTDVNKEFMFFCDRFKVLDYLVEVSKESKQEDFLNYAKYFEALVAYHRFHGGREN